MGLWFMSVSESKRSSFANAVSRLEEAISQEKPDGIVGEMMRDAVIQRFEFTLEVAWKFMRFVLINEGLFRDDVSSPKKAVQAAFANGLISSGEVWLEMVKSRNIVSHVYNEAEAVLLENKIANEFIYEFKQLLIKTENM